MKAAGTAVPARALAPPDRTAAMRKPKAPEANRARIVEAATSEFAARGFKLVLRAFQVVSRLGDHSGIFLRICERQTNGRADIEFTHCLSCVIVPLRLHIQHRIGEPLLVRELDLELLRFDSILRALHFGSSDQGGSLQVL